jgi:hypothetical protein
MVLCEELLLSKAVNNTADFGEFYAKILLTWAQVLEAERDWERALATYDSLTLLYRQLLEEAEEREQQQNTATTSTTASSSTNCFIRANTAKVAVATVLRGTSRCRLQFDADAISSLLPARQAVDSYRLASGGHVSLAKTLEAQSNKEELLHEAYGVVQRGVLYEAPWDEQNQSDNMEQLAYFKEEIRQAEIRRLKEQDFMDLWGNVLHTSETEAFKNARKTWGYTRHRIDFHGVDSDDEDDDDGNDQVNRGNLRQETEQRLRAAASSALTTTTTADAATAAPKVEERSTEAPAAAKVPAVTEHPASPTATMLPPAEQQLAEAATAAAPEDHHSLSLRADAPYFVPRADAPSFVPGFGFSVPAVSTHASPVSAEAPSISTSSAPVNVDTSIPAAASAQAPESLPETASASAPEIIAEETTAAPAPRTLAGETTEAPALATAAEIVDGEEFHDATQQDEEATMELDGNEDFVDDTIDYGNFSKILLTRDVLKWLDDADGKFRDLFIKKLRKLASGQRGYTMQKILKGSQSRIYETYLENKSGHRILWMPDETNHEGVIIYYVVAHKKVCHSWTRWYVPHYWRCVPSSVLLTRVGCCCCHKKVSRYMDLIDDASSRLARPVTSLASDLPEIARETAAAGARAENNDTGHILLDPKRDIPLKMYEVDYNEIEKLHIQSWRPSLHLTPKEREIVETEGTVCVLGRSGTGMYLACFHNISLPTASPSLFALSVLASTMHRKNCGGRESH